MSALTQWTEEDLNKIEQQQKYCEKGTPNKQTNKQGKEKLSGINEETVSGEMKQEGVDENEQL